MKSPLLAFLGLHILFFFSIFDIYFKSPVIQVASRYSSQEHPCRRVFVFVADGMRARTFFEHWEDKAPFLKRMVDLNGLAGISHTRVPTESRPGHVALFAGMYEDPSAITKGWKENPVDFDTVFNQSGLSLSWGSPDILPMFSKGTDKMNIDTYAPEFEDFSSRDLTQLDTWVFDRVAALFQRASDVENHDYELQMNLRKSGLVFFLHLLGSDTNGHAHRPKSYKYINNIRVLDEGIERIVMASQKHWRRDGRTAFIFTSDHGMTDWGSHGSGSDDETRTPLLMWGSGIKNTSEFVNINQVDVAPLISSLLGINFPSNSEGRLPSHLLDIHPNHKLAAEMANSRQIYEQLRAFRERYSKSLFHYEDDHILKDKDFEEMIRIVEGHISRGQFKSAFTISSRLYERAFEGLKYYQRYHRGPLYVATAGSYIGFMAYVALNLAKDYTFVFLSDSKEENNGHKGFLKDGAVCFGVSLMYTWLSCQAWYTFLYFGASLLTLSSLLRLAWSLKLSPSYSIFSKRGVIKSLFIALSVILILEGVFFTFYDRRVLCLSGCIVTLVQVMYFTEYKHTRTRAGKIGLSLWICLNVGICAFAFQPSIGRESSPALALGGSLLAWALYSLVIIFGGFETKGRLLFFSLILPLSGLCVYFSSRPELRSLIHPISWSIASCSLPAALIFFPRGLMVRLVSISLSLSGFYILLSLCYETFFLLCLNGALLTWLWMEHVDSYSQKSLFHEDFSHNKVRNTLELKDIFRSVAFIYFCVASFFGTGNIASINSFDPRSIQTFLTVFSPFTMGSLLLLKVLIPILNVGLYLVSIRSLARLHPLCLLLIVLLFSDVLGLQFFFQVSDTGSWLDIGSSLSNYVIASAIVILMLLIQALEILFKI